MHLSVVWSAKSSAHKAYERAESGNALVVALIVLMVITAASMAYIVVTVGDTRISGNAVASTQALYAAEAGVTEGLHRMAFRSEVNNYIGPTGPPLAGWGRYIVAKSGNSHLDPEAAALAHDGLDNNEDAVVDEPGESYPEVLTKQVLDVQQARYPYVRVEYKTQGGQLVLFGDPDNNSSTAETQNLVAGTPVLRITSRGEQGTGVKVIETEAVKFPLVDIVGAAWAQDKWTLGGNAFLIDGNDHYATAPYDTVPGGTSLPGVATNGPTSLVNLSQTQQDNVTGLGGWPSVKQVTNTYDFAWLWTKLYAMADYKFPGPVSNPPNMGTIDDPKIIAVNGDFETQPNWKGAGILIINGDVATMGPKAEFVGIVIVLGFYSDKNSGGSTDIANVFGAVIARGFSGSGKPSHIGGGGKGSRIFYSSQAVDAANAVFPYSLAWWKER